MVKALKKLSASKEKSLQVSRGFVSFKRDVGQSSSLAQGSLSTADIVWLGIVCGFHAEGHLVCSSNPGVRARCQYCVS